MSMQTDPRFPVSTWAMRIQDAKMISSFGVWVALLGLTPVLLFNALAGS